MRRLFLMLLFAATVATSGCFTPEDRRQWKEAVKDLRGDNLEMKTAPPRRDKSADKPTE